jgi:LuxR family transcriptional regulator, maltose regulon positive regulatory protein
MFSVLVAQIQQDTDRDLWTQRSFTGTSAAPSGPPSPLRAGETRGQSSVRRDGTGAKPSGIGTSPPFPIHESKLTPPLGRRGMVPRVDLLKRLERSSGLPVAAIAAPPGYGKTTLLTQWAAGDPRAFVWLSLDWSEPIDHAVFRALASPDAPIVETVLPRLGSALASRRLPFVLALDDAHLLQNDECLDHVLALVEHLPDGSQLAIAGRGESPLPLARLRAEGRVVEIGADDLAMDTQETAALLRGAELQVPESQCLELWRRTEGWPVALYLAALSLRMGGARYDAIALQGDDRFLVDYLQSVLLSSLPRESVSFLTRTSVLEHLSGPLCDAVLERTGSQDLLESLERSNLLLIPLDRRRHWYRYHQRFREYLRAMLERGAPHAARRLVLRAAAWCEHDGLPEAAIEYAMDAGDSAARARDDARGGGHSRQGGCHPDGSRGGGGGRRRDGGGRRRAGRAGHPGDAA